MDKLLSMINTDAMQITSTTYKEQFVSAWCVPRSSTNG